MLPLLLRVDGNFPCVQLQQHVSLGGTAVLVPLKLVYAPHAAYPSRALNLSWIDNAAWARGTEWCAAHALVAQPRAAASPCRRRRKFLDLTPTAALCALPDNLHAAFQNRASDSRWAIGEVHGKHASRICVSGSPMQGWECAGGGKFTAALEATYG